nr:hypothetical protein [Tanacetum cinerariifolium]
MCRREIVRQPRLCVGSLQTLEVPPIYDISKKVCWSNIPTSGIKSLVRSSWRSRIAIEGFFHRVFVEEEDGAFLGFQQPTKEGCYCSWFVNNRQSGCSSFLLRVNKVEEDQVHELVLTSKIVVIRSSNQVVANQLLQVLSELRSRRVSSVWATRFATTNYLAFRFVNDKVAAGGYRQVKVLEFFDCPCPRQGVEDLRELLHKQRVKRMDSMNTRLNIEKLDGNIVQKYGGSKQVGFKQLGSSVETGVHGVHDEKRVWFEVKLQGVQGDREVKVFQSGVAKHLGVARTQQQNGLVDETNMTLFANVRCFLIQSGLSKVFWVEDTTRSTYLVTRSPSSAIGLKKPVDMLGSFGWLTSIKQGILEPVKVKCIFLGYHKNIVGNKLWRLDDVTSKVVLYRNMGFNESEEYKKTFIGSGIGTGSMHMLHRFEFEVKPLGDHTFEVEPQENIDQGAGLQEVQTQDLMDYQLAHDREQHLACELFGYREDIACEVISKWKAGMKDDMDAWLDVLRSRLPRVCWIKQKRNVLCMEIVRNRSRKILRVSQSRFYNKKLVQTLLEGHSILSLKGSLLGDCDVEKNDIASADVGILDKFDRGLQTNVQVFVDFDYAMCRSITRYGFMILGCPGSLKANLQHMKALPTTEAGYMTFTEAWKKKIWLKGLLTKSRYELRLVAGIATSALVKVGSRSEVPAQVEVAAYRY